jgi:hypothetical protein
MRLRWLLLLPAVVAGYRSDPTASLPGGPMPCRARVRTRAGCPVAPPTRRYVQWL